MTTRQRKPAAFKPGDKGVEIAEPAAAPEAQPELVVAGDATGTTQALQPAPAGSGSETAAPASSRWRWGALFGAAATGLISLAAGLAVTELVEGFYARHPWLGHAGLALLAAALLACLAIVLRELLALSRLRKLERIRIAAERAHRHNDARDAKSVMGELKAIYSNRPDMKWPLDRLREQDGEVMDATDRLALAEKVLMGDLDRAAGSIIARAGKRVSIVTAVNPAPVLDMLVVAAQNLAMIRQLATLYSSRPATIGTIKLARMVITHLAVSGGLAIGDNLIQHILGRGLAGRLSAKIGEGAVNGIMTARIGIAALDLCRPLGFHVLARPTLQSVLGGVLSGGKSEEEEPPNEKS